MYQHADCEDAAENSRESASKDTEMNWFNLTCFFSFCCKEKLFFEMQVRANVPYTRLCTYKHRKCLHGQKNLHVGNTASDAFLLPTRDKSSCVFVSVHISVVSVVGMHIF